MFSFVLLCPFHFIFFFLSHRPCLYFPFFRLAFPRFFFSSSLPFVEYPVFCFCSFRLSCFRFLFLLYWRFPTAKTFSDIAISTRNLDEGDNTVVAPTAAAERAEDGREQLVSLDAIESQELLEQEEENSCTSFPNPEIVWADSRDDVREGHPQYRSSLYKKAERAEVPDTERNRNTALDEVTAGAFDARPRVAFSEEERAVEETQLYPRGFFCYIRTSSNVDLRKGWYRRWCVYRVSRILTPSTWELSSWKQFLSFSFLRFVFCVLLSPLSFYFV